MTSRVVDSRPVFPLAAVFGLAACLATTLAAAGIASTPVFEAAGLGALPLAVALGMILGNVWPRLAVQGGAGLAIARGPVMRAGIALYGLRVGADELGLVGWQGVTIAILIVASTLVLAVVAGRRLGVERDAALLVGTGSAICGAAAIAAADGVVCARARQVSAAVAAVVVFGTLGMYGLPVVRGLVDLSDTHFGMWIGLTVHELGHVVAAANGIGGDAAPSALIEKMLRVMLLAPAVVAIAFFRGREAGGAGRLRPPLFLCGFVVAIALNLAGALPDALQTAGAELAQWLLAFGLAALGAATRFYDVRQAGVRIWALALLLWGYLLAAAYALLWVAAQAG